MIEIDGAHGEGGGQLVRTAVAVSAVRCVPVRIINIRARRRKPGLAAQHVAAVRAVAALCDAQCEGVETGSQSLCFVPRRLRGLEVRRLARGCGGDKIRPVDSVAERVEDHVRRPTNREPLESAPASRPSTPGTSSTSPV